MFNNNEIFDMLIKTLPCVMWAIDLDTYKITYLSPNIEDLLGWPAEQITGRRLMDLNISPFYKDKIFHLINDTDEKGTISFTIEVKHKLGHKMFMEISGTRLLNEKLPIAVGSACDVTEHICHKEKLIWALLDILSESEKKTAIMLSGGKCKKEIARILNVDVNTVYKNISRIKSKLKIADYDELSDLINNYIDRTV